MLLFQRFHFNGRLAVVRRFHDSAPYREVIRNPTDAWIVKVVCTLIVRSPSLDSYLIFFRKILNPLIAFEVVKRLKNPILGLKFFEFSRKNSDFNHSNKTYCFLVKSLCQMGLQDSAKVVFDEMRLDGHCYDSSVLGILVSSYGEVGKFDIAMGLLVEAHEHKCRANLPTYNNLLNLLVKKNKVSEAIRFFKERLRPSLIADACTFNIIIKGLCRLGDVALAFEFLNDMGSFGCFPDAVTYNTLIDGMCRASEVDGGFALLKEIQSKGVISPDVVTYTAIISGYCKMGKMEAASTVFSEMVSFGARPNLVTYNVLINGYGKAGDMVSALSVYEKMIVQGCIPDVVTFTSLIDGYCRSGMVDDAMKLWNEMRRKNLSPNAYTFAITINTLCKENRLNEARDLLKQLNLRGDIFLRPFMYNPVIDGFCKAGDVDEANLILEEMEGRGCAPDKLTFTILIIGHCMKGRMSDAISLFHKMLSTGCAPDTITISSLISCLLKAGMPNEANQIVLVVSAKDFDLDLDSSSKLLSLRKNMDIPVAA